MSCKTYLAECIRITPDMIQYVNTNLDPFAWAPGTFTVDAIRTHYATPTQGWMEGISLLRDFRSLVDSNTSEPSTDPAKWQDIGPSNSVAMFTSKLAEKTLKAPGGFNGIAAIVAPPVLVDTVAFFGLSGSRVIVEILDADDNILSSEYKDIITQPDVFNWLDFFTQVPTQNTQAVFTDLFCMPGSKISISILGSDAECGRCVIGRAVHLGSAPQYGASWTVDNYTSADPDEFGYVDPVTRDYAPRNQVSLYIDPLKSNLVLDLLARLRATPVLLLASPDDRYTNAMVNYGLIRDPNYVIAGPSHNLLDFEFKGFV